MVTYLCSLAQLCCGEGGALQANLTGVCGERSQYLSHTGLAPAHGACAFPIYTAQAPDCSAVELSKVGPGLGALPSPKPLRFKFSGTSQRHRLDWAYVLCPSQVRAAQVNRCLANTVSQFGGDLITSLVPGTRFPGCTAKAPSQVCRVSPLEG